MCQAFEGEQRAMFAHDRYVRRKGWDAQKAGVPREDNQEPDHPLPDYSDKNQWWLGWDTAAKGEEPW